MKYKNYGDKNEEYANGNSLEMITSSDPLSARSVNRPIANIYEDQKETYKLLNTLLKSVYGNANNGIIPDIYESFCPEGFIINSFKNDINNYFLRIPSGMMLLDNKKPDSNRNKYGNPFSINGEYDYLDTSNRNKYTKDEDSSFVFDNRPNINLLERQLANFIALDLTDLTNDIRINCDEIPMCYPVCIVDTNSKYQKKDPDGNLSYVTDNSGNFLYICENEDNATYFLTDTKKTERKINYNFKSQGDNSKYFGDDYKTSTIDTYYIEKQDGEKVELLTKKPSGKAYIALTTSFRDAKKVLDYNGNEKKMLGYYMSVNRATTEDDEITYLPNKKENAFWKICLPYGGSINAEGKKDEYNYYITLKDHKGDEISRWNVFFFDYASEENLNNMIFNKLLVEGDQFFTLSKYQFRINGSEIKHGVKISMRSESINCDKYTLTISYSKNKANEVICTTQDLSTGWKDGKIKDVLPEAAQRQKYYNNIFELTNAFLGRYSSYQVSIGNIYNYLSGELIIKLPLENKFSLYYDLNYDTINNRDNRSYDKSGRIFASSNSNLTDKNLIKLFDIETETSAAAGFAPRIKNMLCYIKELDRRLISTKRAELNSLISNNRTELINYVDIKDFDENRRFEITEDSKFANNEQVRLTSPISRLSTKNSIEKGEEPKWNDKLDGDTPSDFYDSYTSRNFINNKETTQYHLDDDMGIIINENKGIKIYNNDEIKLADPNSHNKYSDYKPIEINSSKGNINILNTDSDTSRIGIKNLKDSEDNVIDLLGITRIRSKQRHQLVIRSINEMNKSENKCASIAFMQGPSKANDNKNAFSVPFSSENNMPSDIMIGNIEFDSGKDSGSKNVSEKNRRARLNLSETESNSTMKTVFEARNAKSKNGKKIFTMFGDFVPSNKSGSIGFPLLSRSFTEDVTSFIPYEKNKELNKIFVDNLGNTQEGIETEDRWLAAFVKYGFMKKLTLADREKDIINSDSRDGNLRMGNGNIYDVSSIYINYDTTGENGGRANLGTINFDNVSEDKENTILSVSDEDDNNSNLNFIISRTTNNRVNEDPSEDNLSEGFNSLRLSLKGAEIGKSLEVRRQLFVNNHVASTNSDNNAFVVKGQSVLNGELIVGKKSGAKTYNYAKKEVGYTGNSEKENENKKYNTEYSKLQDDDTLYMFRTYGRNYFDGDITINPLSKLTEKTTFDKYIVINNNAYEGKTYDTKNDGKDSLYYSNNKNDDDYTITDGKSEEEIAAIKKATSRHHKALDVVNGTIIFGSETKKNNKNYDASDLKLFGSQWIKRRLEIGSSIPVLIDTYMNKERLIEDVTKSKESEASYKKESPYIYVDGSSLFNGDVVFGGNLHEYDFTPEGSDVSYKCKYIKNHRTAAELASKITEGSVKTIFWGNCDNKGQSGKENSSLSISDFDFHGCAWFDNLVKIGCDANDIGSQDSFNNNGRLYIKGNKESLQGTSLEDNWGKEKSALRVEGSISVKNEGFNSIVGKRVHVQSGVEDNKVDLYLGGSSSNTKACNGTALLKTDTSAEIISNKTNNITLKSTGININSDAADINIKSGKTSIDLDNSKSIILSTDLSDLKAGTVNYSKVIIDDAKILIDRNGELSINMDDSEMKLKSTDSNYISIKDDTTIKAYSNKSISIEGPTDIYNGSYHVNVNNSVNIKFEDSTGVKSSIELKEKSITCESDDIKLYNSNALNIYAGGKDDKQNKIVTINPEAVAISKAVSIGNTVKLNPDGTISSAKFIGQVGDPDIVKDIYGKDVFVSNVTSSISLKVGDDTTINSTGISTNKLSSGSSVITDGSISTGVFLGQFGNDKNYNDVYVKSLIVNGFRVDLIS